MNKKIIAVLVVLFLAVFFIDCFKINWQIKADIANCDRITVYKIKEGFLKPSEEAYDVCYHGEEKFQKIADDIQSCIFVKRINQDAGKYAHESEVNSIRIEFSNGEEMLWKIITYDDGITIINNQYVFEVSASSDTIYNDLCKEGLDSE